MLEGGKVKQAFELKGQGCSIRGIARTFGISKDTVKKYLRSPGMPRSRPRPKRPSLLDPPNPVSVPRWTWGPSSTGPMMAGRGVSGPSSWS